MGGGARALPRRYGVRASRDDRRRLDYPVARNDHRTGRVALPARDMKPGFNPGIVREVTVTVTKDMCPTFDGVLVHPCYSTWALVHHMEIAARKVLVDFLEPNEEGIGSHVSVDHLAPCRLGKTVTVRAELLSVSDGRHPQVICAVSAFDGDRVLGRGRQVQVVMKKDELTRLIERS